MYIKMGRFIAYFNKLFLTIVLLDLFGSRPVDYKYYTIHIKKDLTLNNTIM